MLVPFVPPLRGRRRRTRRKAAPVALTLAAASFDAGTLVLRLTFNKPVDVTDIFPGNLQVDDSVSATQYEGQGPVTQPTPSVVEVVMFELQAQAYPDTRLRALAPTGIVAVGDAEAWPGVVNLLLPFP